MMDNKKEQTAALVQVQQSFFASGKTLSTVFRKEQLKQLRKVIISHQTDIEEALHADLGKAPFEAYETEIGLVLEEISYAIRHVASWARPKRVSLSAAHFPAAARIYRDPHGVVLIMSPWNYPFLLTMAPLISAIAAGNCAIVKPSRYSLHTSELIISLIADTFDQHYIAAVCGGREENTLLLEQPFDFIFFTGSPAVGKVVAQAAAQRLVPVCLELGGKSPCIVDTTADIELAARRIIWGKLLNAGQTCVAPDYVLVCEQIKDRLLAAMNRYIKMFYGTDPVHNDQYPSIINEHHFDRLCALADKSNPLNGTAICNAVVFCDRTIRKIAPVLLDNPAVDSPVMQDEIFGPILPVLPIRTVTDAMQFISQRPTPLALYLFSNDVRVQKEISLRLRFGGGCINDTIMHLATPRLPFGGAGNSGLGQYHGKFGFETFSRPKTVVKKSSAIDIPIRYPPYSATNNTFIHFIMK